MVGLIVAVAALAFVSSACNPQLVESMIRQRWAGTGQEDRAVAIARCESHLEANPAGDARHQYQGVFQIGRREWATYGQGDPHDPGSNIDAAFRYWQVSGWGPWECAR